MKRFYKLVSSVHEKNGYTIHLDGRPVKTPAGKALMVPNGKLADEAVREWAAQTDMILPDTMPVTQILITAQDRVSSERPAMESAVLAYLDTDLLCYRTTYPHDMAQKQAGTWNPWLVWFEKNYGVGLRTTEALTALRQPEEAHKAVATYVKALDDLRFTVLQLVTVLSSSLVLGLAFLQRSADSTQIEAAARVEENHKADFYREDFHGLAPHEEKKQAALRRDLDAAAKILTSLSS